MPSERADQSDADADLDKIPSLIRRIIPESIRKDPERVRQWLPDMGGRIVVNRDQPISMCELVNLASHDPDARQVREFASAAARFVRPGSGPPLRSWERRVFQPVEEISHDVFRIEPSQYEPRPIDADMIQRFFRSLRCLAAKYKAICELRNEISVDGNKYDLVDRVRNEFGVTMILEKSDIETVTAFITEVRVTHQLGLAKCGRYVSATACSIVLEALRDTRLSWNEQWSDLQRGDCRQMLASVLRSEPPDDWPSPEELAALLEEECALATVYLRERDIAMPSTPTAETDSANSAPLASVEDWSDLAIGIDEKHKFYANTSGPEFGAAFHKKQAVLLDLRGNRWKKLLTLLAGSPDGQTVSCAELVRRLGYLPPPSQVATDPRARPGELHAATQAELTSCASGARKMLNGTLKDLRRELRKLIDGPSGRQRTCLRSNGERINAGFRVAHILTDESGHLRFGDARP